MNIFNTIKTTKVDSNVFDLSYDMKLSLNMGDLIPIHCQEIVPGDNIKMSTESLLRFAPLIAPVMHKVDVYQHFFFVPNRILWSGWEDFITDTKKGAAVPAFPALQGIAVPVGSLADYLGLPITPDTKRIDKVSALPFAAYQKIYNEYYRDQNLIPEVPTDLQDGNGNNPADFTPIRKRAWQHDYFTASLPFAQKGDAVQVPLGDVYLKPDLTNSKPRFQEPNALSGSDGAVTSTYNNGIRVGVSTNKNFYNPDGSLAVGSTTINDLRKAFRLQEWLEKSARGGSRLAETILSHFGVKSSDARLQRPEYLGGSKQPMVISEVLQTAEGTETPQGNMAGHGISVGGGKQFSYYAEEHGYIIGIMSIMPKTAYQQGIPKHFSKFDKLDYYWPSFAHLGEQEVKNRELYYDIALPDNDATFGYVPRYSEYKYNDARVAGDFRQTLSFWHLGRIFTARPNLNKAFVECNPSTRIFAVEDPAFHNVYAHVFHRISAVRKMPKYGTPSF